MTASGPLGTRAEFFGKYRGIVTDTNDPLSQGRLQAKVPAVLGDVPSGWALPCQPCTGDGSALYLVPSPGTGVWIEFEGGDPDCPIWTGGWWGLGTLPRGEASRQTQPSLKVLRSEQGLVVALDDDRTITLSDSSGTNLVTIRASQGEVRVQATGKTVVEAPLIELVEDAPHPVVLGDLLLAYLNPLVTIFNTHLHVGEMPVGITPVTPAPPAAPFLHAPPSLLSTRVTSG